MNTATQFRKQLSGSGGLSRSLGTIGAALRGRLWVWPAVAALLFGGVGWWVHRSVEDAMREEMAGQLTTILNADIEALHIWMTGQETMARSIARSPALRQSVRGLLAAADRPGARTADLLQSPETADCLASLKPYLGTSGYTHFYIVSPALRIVAANEDEPTPAFKNEYPRAFAQKALDTGGGVSKPFRSGLSLPDAKGELKSGLPTMLAAAVIPDEAGKPLALLAFRLRPDKEFSEILQTARFGSSGETYAFSETGLLLSQSRFDGDLKRLGLLPDVPDAQSTLTVEARDPGVNLMDGGRPSRSRAEQPLTRLVQKAVSEGGGVVMDAYGDYRGSPSVGACRWLPKEGFGVAVEVDVADAFQALTVLRRAIWTLFGLLLLSAGGLFVFLLLVARQQRRAEKAERAVQQLGQYTLEEKIGEGGMGSVYRARHALRRPTAVKMLNADNVGDEALARFEREVQLTSQLRHPNTIAVYDYGRTADGVFYYAMEYLDGVSLEDLVEKWGPLPEGRIVPILRQICGSLAEAHAVGLIHRDVKPANIFLTARAGLADFVKVLDFGLVKAADTSEAAKLTQANVTVGTPHYLSPEAVENPETVTLLADVYAIGAVAYYLVTGTVVFDGKTVLEICIKHVRTPPEPPSQRLGRPVSAGLESLILRCLAKNPAERPPGTRALADELDRLESAGGWTRADADAWWAAFSPPSEDRAKAPTEPKAPERTVALPTGKSG